MTTSPGHATTFQVESPRYLLDEHSRELLYFALRVTCLIVFPAPSLFVVLLVGSFFQVVVTLITLDPSFFSTHKWCWCLAAFTSGHILWKLRKRPFFEFSGIFGQIIMVGAVAGFFR